MEYKQTPWKIGAMESGMVAIDSSDDKEVTGYIDPEDARRILACVNALQGVPTDQLESVSGKLAISSSISMWQSYCDKKMQLEDAIEQRDELQEEVNALKERAEYDLAEFARTLDISYDEIKLLKKQRDDLLAAANQCRIDLVTQIHELADHIDRAEYCIADPDTLKQINGQRQYAMAIADKWNQNGNPFVAITSVKSNAS